MSVLHASTTQRGTSFFVLAVLIICARLLQRPFAMAARYSLGAASLHCAQVCAAAPSATPAPSARVLSPHVCDDALPLFCCDGRLPRSSGSRLSWTPSETSRSMSPSQHRAMCTRKLRRSGVGNTATRMITIQKNEWCTDT